MNGLDFLNLVIGLIFIYLIYSIACTTIWELFVNILHLRGKMLRNWFFNTFKEELGEDILKHPLFRGLSNSEKKLPNYISSALFSDILTDIIVNSKGEGEDTTNLPVDINTFKVKLENTELLDIGLKRVFLQYISEASGDFQKVKEKIGKWFDEAQEGLIGSFKKKLQRWIFIFAIVLVGITNADTIKLATYLYNNPETRETLANKAELFIQDSAVINTISKIDTTIIDSLARMEQKEIAERLNKNLETLKKLDEELKESSIPIGWTKKELESLEDCKAIVIKIGGLLLSIFAVSLGSPFWFDILNKLSNLRSSGNKPKSTFEEEPS
jgi:hypothetical protein